MDWPLLKLWSISKRLKTLKCTADNQSEDHTVEIAKRYPIDHVVNIKEFLPGLALNKGIRKSSGKYIVCLSAHCVP